jgi:hypothetical protein
MADAVSTEEIRDKVEAAVTSLEEVVNPLSVTVVGSGRYSDADAYPQVQKKAGEALDILRGIEPLVAQLPAG